MIPSAKLTPEELAAIFSKVLWHITRHDMNNLRAHIEALEAEVTSAFIGRREDAEWNQVQGEAWTVLRQERDALRKQLADLRGAKEER